MLLFAWRKAFTLAVPVICSVETLIIKICYFWKDFWNTSQQGYNECHLLKENTQFYAFLF